VVVAAFDDDDGVGGRAADGALLVVELDREGVLADVDGDDAAGVDAPQRDGLAADADRAGRADATLDGDGFGASQIGQQPDAATSARFPAARSARGSGAVPPCPATTLGGAAHVVCPVRRVGNTYGPACGPVSKKAGSARAVAAFPVDPPEDVGAATADRYMFQYCCAASRLLAALAQGEDRELFCEWHEDYLLSGEVGVEAVSVKHREDHLPAWSRATLVSDGKLKHLLDTFQSATGIDCCFETNRAHVVGDLWQARDGSLDAARNDLAARLGTSRSDLDEFLAHLVITTPGVPSRHHIEYSYAAQYAAPALDRLGLNRCPPSRALRIACELVANASRERIIEAAWLALLTAKPTQRAGVLAAHQLEARRVTTDDLRKSLAEADRHHVPSLQTVAGAAPAETTLTKKLVRGGLGPSVVESARRRRRLWYSHVASFRDIGTRENELRSLREWVQDQANAAELDSMDETSYGPQMYRALLERLRAEDAVPKGTWPEDRDPSLLAGAVFELTDECSVWWSPSFAVGDDVSQ
jgi:hypothetical protein